MKDIRRSGLPVLVLLAFGVGLALSGCGGIVVDSQKAEDAIAQNVEEQTNVRVESVSCPDDVQVETGATFECQITTSEGRNATAELRILNEDADVKIVRLSKS